MAPGNAPAERGEFLGKTLIAGLVVALALLAYALRHVLLLLFAAVLIAVGMRGLAGVVARVTPLKGNAALAVAALLLLTLIASGFWLLGAQIAAQVSDLIERLPSAWESVRAQLAGNRYGARLLAELESARSSGAGVLAGVASRLGGFTLTFAGVLLDLLVVLIAAAFLAVSPNTYRSGLLSFTPKPRRQRIGEALDAAAIALRKWLAGTLMSMAFLTGAITLGLWALGVPAPLALGLLAGLAQFVPLIGPIVAAAPGLLIALTVGPQTALWTFALYVVASQVEGNLVYPIIQQKAVSIAPVVTLFAVIGVGLLLGPLGAVLATPIAVVISVFLTIFYVRQTLGDTGAKVPGQ